MPPVVTVIEGVVAPLLHSNVPVYPVAVNTELPQLFTTLTTGVGGKIKGDDEPLPAGPVHPLIVCTTVYVAELFTVINEDVDPLLHRSVPL